MFLPVGKTASPSQDAAPSISTKHRVSGSAWSVARAEEATNFSLSLREIGFSFLLNISAGVNRSVCRVSFENLSGSDLAARTKACLLRSFQFVRPVSLQMDEPSDKQIKECLEWILMVSLSPIAFLLFMLMALYGLLRFLYKVALLFIIIAINTPFAVMYNLSILVFHYNLARFRKYYARFQKFIPARFQKSSPGHFQKSSSGHWSWSDPRASVHIEIKLIVSDFFKTVAGELLLGMSTGIITYFTAPLSVFYYSTIIWLVAILHKWMNTNCPSKTALSCLCDAYGLSPMMFLFSFIGFFDIGCHPIAKCSFAASKAFLFVRDVPYRYYDEDMIKDPVFRRNSDIQVFHAGEGLKESNTEEGHSKLNKKDGRKPFLEPTSLMFKWERDEIEVDVEQGDKETSNVVPVVEPFPGFGRLPSLQLGKSENYLASFDVEEGDKKFDAERDLEPSLQKCPSVYPSVYPPVYRLEYPLKYPIKPAEYISMEEGDIKWHQFNGELIDSEHMFIEFSEWNAFERGLFQLSPRIDFISRPHGKYILKSFMVLKLFRVNLCKYLVERLELPEDYSKANKLFNFLKTLSLADGFVTDKMRGRYEHSLTLLEIVEGVEESVGYKIVKPMDKRFVVAGCI